MSIGFTDLHLPFASRLRGGGRNVDLEECLTRTCMLFHNSAERLQKIACLQSAIPSCIRGSVAARGLPAAIAGLASSGSGVTDSISWRRTSQEDGEGR